MKNNFMYILLLSMVLGMVTGCSTTPNKKAEVHIVYDQVANFHVYSLGGNSTTGAGDGMFIQYRINRITNVGQEAKAFVFDKHKVVAIHSGTSNEEPSGDNILLGAKFAQGFTVQPGDTKINVGCFIKHVSTPDPQSLTSALVDIMHQIVQSQPVVMNRAQSDQTTAAVGTATPQTLQNLCGPVY